MSSWQRTPEAGRVDLLSTPIMRVGAWTTATLLATAYLTGEEFRHTHAALGYGLAAVLVAMIVWESVRPRDYRAANLVSGAKAGQAALNGPITSQPSAPPLIAAGLVVLVGGLALVALAILWVTHTFWSTVNADEAHEAIAYISFGLALFYLSMVIFGISHEIAMRFGALRR